jgi:Uma2 family endonuclease
MLLREHEQHREYTFEEFWEIATAPENADRRLELDEGDIIDMGASSKKNTVTAGRLIYFLNTHVIPNNLGYVTSPDAGFKLSSRGYRQPDVAFIGKAKMQDLEGTYFTIAPDLAVEVVSPNEDIFKKVREYLRIGTLLVWAVYTDEQKVYVFSANSDGSLLVQPYGIEDTLDGGVVLPGFKLAVKDIFPE